MNSISESQNIQDNNEEIEKWICCLSYSQNEIGISIYSTISQIIEYCQVSIADSISNLLTNVFMMRPPTIILLNAKLSEDITNIVKEVITEEMINPQILFQKSVNFDYEKAIQTIQSSFQSDQTDQTEQLKQTHFSFLDSQLDKQSKEMIRSIGCLLTFLPSYLSQDCFEGDTCSSFLHSFKPLQLSDYMNIDKNTLNALDIFVTVNHPSLIKGLGKEKQGFTLYSLLEQHIFTPLGRRLLKQWIVSPLKNQKEIENRQDVIAFYQQPQLKELRNALEKEISHISDIPSCCRRICTFKETIHDWFHLFDSISSLLEVSRINEVMMKYSNQTIPELIQLAPSLLQSEEVKQFSFFLQQVFDYKQSYEKKELIIQTGVDSSLDQYRMIYQSMTSILDECTVATKQALLQSFPISSYFDTWGYEFLPRIGYVFTIPMQSIEELGLQTPSVLHSSFPSDFQYQFHTEDCVYYKTDIAIQLDHEYGDIHATIKDLEKNVLRLVANRIDSIISILLNCSSVIAELDILLSWSILCMECNFIRPVITSENILHVVNSRHPLQELVTDQFIPNPIEMENHDSKNIMILTGPNSSGKSIYMKQIALIVYMNQIGCFVPADSAILTLFSSLYTKFITTESISDDHSSFTQDCTLITRILSSLTNHSLILIDEFGKGTKTEDGIALFLALIHYCLTLSNNHSFFILSTHFSDYLTENYLQVPLHMLSLKQMKVLLDINQEHTITPLFQIEDGISKDSLGIDMASMMGLSSTIIHRAECIYNSIHNNQNITLEEELVHSDKQEQIVNVIQKVFSIENWKDASNEELYSLLQLMNSLG